MRYTRQASTPFRRPSRATSRSSGSSRCGTLKAGSCTHLDEPELRDVARDGRLGPAPLGTLHRSDRHDRRDPDPARPCECAGTGDRRGRSRGRRRHRRRRRHDLRRRPRGQRQRACRPVATSPGRRKPVNGIAVLAYSGGLDTSCAIAWLKEDYGFEEVVAVLVDVGQEASFRPAIDRGKLAGADDVLLLDRKEAFADEQVAKAVLANALYEGKYPLVSALSRPVIAEAVAEVAVELGADAVVHGCTGKGN